MPSKETKTGRAYDVTAKQFTWHPLDDDGEAGNLPDVTIPMRIKVKVLRAVSGDQLDADAMFRMLESLIPGQSETLDEMDVNDFVEMFSTWQTEYNAVTGATPGE